MNPYLTNPYLGHSLQSPVQPQLQTLRIPTFAPPSVPLPGLFTNVPGFFEKQRPLLGFEPVHEHRHADLVTRVQDCTVTDFSTTVPPAAPSRNKRSIVHGGASCVEQETTTTSVPIGLTPRAQRGDLTEYIPPYRGQLFFVISTIQPSNYNPLEDDMALILFGAFRTQKKAEKKCKKWQQQEKRLTFEVVRMRCNGIIPKPRNARSKTVYANKEMDDFKKDYVRHQRAPDELLEQERFKVRKDEHDTCFPLDVITVDNTKPTEEPSVTTILD
jgi:hypothetical protein